MFLGPFLCENVNYLQKLSKTLENLDTRYSVWSALWDILWLNYQRLLITIKIKYIISNHLIFLLSDERDAIQKKTFTKWVNKHLKKVKTLYFIFFHDRFFCSYWRWKICILTFFYTSLVESCHNMLW